eukprot:gene5009-6955_t
MYQFEATTNNHAHPIQLGTGHWALSPKVAEVLNVASLATQALLQLMPIPCPGGTGGTTRCLLKCSRERKRQPCHEPCSLLEGAAHATRKERKERLEIFPGKLWLAVESPSTHHNTRTQTKPPGHATRRQPHDILCRCRHMMRTTT